ncbi:MAG: ATP-binding protein [Niveispirillum sp.]|nr:ATP-binding protein [Niveispirillum sp.]
MMTATTTLGNNNSHCVTINATGNVAFTQVQTAQIPPQKPWFNTQPLGKNNHLSLLRWDRRVCERVGRDAEFEELLAWTDDGDPGVQARLITGDGGTGKSRLAGDLAQELVERGWRAEKLADRLTEQLVLPLGEFQPREDTATLAQRTPTRQTVAKPAYKGGLLIVIDYPEGRMPLVERLLESLRDYAVQEDIRVRLLLLSRRDSQEWDPVIERARAEGLFQTDAIHLGRSNTPAAQFVTILNGVAKALKQTPPPLPAGEPDKWLSSNRAYQQPLFLAAVALHFCLHPEAGLTLGGPEAVTALVRRERTRAENESVGLGWEPNILPRLLALATLRGGLESAKLNELGQMLGVPAGPDLCDRLRNACDGRIRDNVLVALEPDLPGAAFATLVLSERADMAPDWIWQTIVDNPMGLIPRLEQVCHDAEGTLQLLSESRISWLLTAMVAFKPDRAQALRDLAYSMDRSHRLAALAVMVGQILLGDASLDDDYRSRLLNNLSADLFDAGDAKGALETIIKAVAIRETLAIGNPGRFNPDLAMSLNNLSLRLSDAGDTKGALDAIRRAVTIHKVLAAEDPGRFNTELANCLNSYSNRLSDTGDAEGALDAITDAVKVYETLAAEEPDRFNQQLAASLNNLSNHLFHVGDQQRALNASIRSVGIIETLAAKKPGRFNPNLASALNNLSVDLAHSGDVHGSLNVIRKAVAIRERLAAENPARFNSDLASSLNNLSVQLSETGDRNGALDAIRRTAAIYRMLAKENPGRFNPDLARSLSNLSNHLYHRGKVDGALDAISQAVTIYETLTAENPGRFCSDFAGTLAILAQLTFKGGDRVEAIRLVERAINLIEPQANAYPESQAGHWLYMMQQELAGYLTTPP